MLPRYSHPKSPHHYTLPQLAACVLLTFYLRLSYRDMEEWLRASDQVRAVLELPRVPDHATLARAYQRLLRMEKLAALQRARLEQLGVEEEVIAVDATGFAPTQASQYYQSRTGRQLRAYHKGVYAVGARSQFILAWRQGKGPSNDAPFLGALRRAAGRYGCPRVWVLVADRGFDGRYVQAGDVIPPIRRGGALTDAQRVARAELVAAARLDGVWGQRWKSETVISVIKRRLGDAIRSRRRDLQRREPAVKALVYNLHR